MHFEDWTELVVHGFEAVGVVILAIGSVVALVNASLPLVRGGRFGLRARSTERRSSRVAGSGGVDHRRHRGDDHDRAHHRERPGSSASRWRSSSRELCRSAVPRRLGHKLMAMELVPSSAEQRARRRSNERPY